MKLFSSLGSQLVFAIVASAAIQVTPTALATPAKAPRQHTLTMKEAESIALKEFPGDVVESERESFHKKDAYSVEIKSGENLCEIVVEASDGKILSKKVKNRGEDDEDDDGDEGEK